MYKFLGCAIDMDERNKIEVIKKIGTAKSSFGKTKQNINQYGDGFWDTIEVV